MADRALTPKQQETLDLLRAFAVREGYQPSLRELGDLLGLRSASSVHSRLEGLERAGVIRRIPGRARAVEIVATAAGADAQPNIQMTTEDERLYCVV